MTSINTPALLIVMQLDAAPEIGRGSRHNPAPSLRHRHTHQLGPILSTLELLADSQRVIREFEAAATASVGQAHAGPGSLGPALRKACPTWRDPIRDLPGECGLSVIQQLARVAVELNREIGGEWKGLIESLRQATAAGMTRQPPAGR